MSNLIRRGATSLWSNSWSSVGRGRGECGPLVGHHGGERCILSGLKVWRINTKYNLIHVHGPAVPGENGNYVNIMDSRMPNKTLDKTAISYLDLKIEEKDNQTYVEAVPTKTGREGRVVKTDSKSQACALCKLNLTNLEYTDVMILSQFVKCDGSLATWHESKLCSKQYSKVVRLIKLAQRCNLIKRPPDYLSPGPWHDLNTYLEPDRKRDQPMKVIKKQYWKI